MKKTYLTVRSLILWAVSGIHFAMVGTFSSFSAFSSILARTTGPSAFSSAIFCACRSAASKSAALPGFDPTRTSIFICNHVNLFDPFVIYSAIPQFLRGFELESHFKVPVYGWIMGRFGNIPVPDVPSREGLEIMTQRAKAALDSGISLIAFAEGSRTRNGHVKPFKKGIFNLAQDWEFPSSR